jgi:hypothetical protein
MTTLRANPGSGTRSVVPGGSCSKACNACGRPFTVTTPRRLWSIRGLALAYATCPHCQARQSIYLILTTQPDASAL